MAILRRSPFTLSLILLLLLAACRGDDPAGGDPERGAERFGSLPCAGCHGVAAQGQFGPPLAGTTLTFAEVQAQVRNPREQMPAFSRDAVSEQALRDIYAWLTGLPRPEPTPAATLPPAAATEEALDRRFPLLQATELAARRAQLDESAFRVDGEILSVVEEGRFTQVRVRVDDGETVVELAALYDTALARGAFPAGVGDHVTLYGIGANPISDPAGDTLPQMQVLYVR